MWLLYILIHISLLLKTLFVHALVHVLRRFWIRTVYTSPKSSYPYVLNPYLEYKIVNVVFFLIIVNLVQCVKFQKPNHVFLNIVPTLNYDTIT
jgi:hypothetical protein